MVKLLLERKADPKIPDEDKLTALHLAARTALHFAANAGCEDESDLNLETCKQVIRSLLEGKAEISAENALNETPLDLAGSALSRIFDKTADLFRRSVESAGPQAVELLLSWTERAQIRKGKKTLGLQRAHLSQRVRVVIAPRSSDLLMAVKEEDVDLCRQDLFPAPQCHASLKVVPGLAAAHACDCRILRCLAEASNDAIFQSDAVQALVSAAWQQLRFTTAWEVSLDIANVVFPCIASAGIRQREGCCSNEFLWIVVALHAKRTAEELWQYGRFLFRCSGVRSRKKCSVDLGNVMDFIYLAVGWSAISLHLEHQEPAVEKPIMSVFCVLVWLRALYSLRGESWLGPRLLPILWAVKDTLAFILVTVVCTLAATHAYYMLCINIDASSDLSQIYAAFVQVVRLGIFSDFALADLEGHPRVYNASTNGTWTLVNPEPRESHFWVHGFFYVCGIGI